MCNYIKLNIDGTYYKTKSNKMFDERKNWEATNENLIVSYIPGTIVEIFIKVGDKVVENKLALTLEAMKMENKIVFPKSGTVKAVNVKLGDKIPKGFTMIEIE